MRIDNARFTGSVDGSEAIASLSGSFTGSGHIELSNTASYNFASASVSASNIIFHRADGILSTTTSIDLNVVNAAVTGSVIQGLTQSFFLSDNTSYENYINLSGSEIEGVTFRDAIVTGSFSGSFTGVVSGSLTNAQTASLAERIENSLDQGLGIETFSYDDDTAGLIVQLDTSSAHFTVGVSASQAPTLTALSASFSTSQTALSSSLTATDQAISSSNAALSASASTARTALSASLSDNTYVEAVTNAGAATFNIVHNLDSNFPIIATYNSLNQQVIPDIVEIINNNQVDVTYAGAFTGNIVVKK